mgnify:CR=1 FL=1
MDEPLLQLTYTLTTADALAYEVLPREMVGWRKLLFFLWLGSVGAIIALLPPEWVGTEWGWQFWLVAIGLMGLAWLLAAAAMTVSRHLAARRRLPSPATVELKQWPDHLEIVTAGRQSFVAYETIAAVTTTPTHVFVTAPPQVVILPASAFASAAEMASFGEEIDRLSREAVP